MKNSICAGFVSNKIRISSLLFLIMMIAFGNKTAYSQCDPEIIPVENREIAYQKRSNDERCEGFYSQKVAAAALELVGAVKGDFRFKSDRNEVIELSSPVVSDETVYVQAVGIPIKTYYRMDARIFPGKKLRWPIGDVLCGGQSCEQSLSERKIAVIGWIESKNGKVYAPIRAVSKLNPCADNDSISLCFRTSVDVETVKWRTAGGIGRDCASPGDWKETRKSDYRSGQPIFITLPPVKDKILCVEVAAKERNSAGWLIKHIQVRIGEDEK